MFCTKCGNKLNDNAIFCTSCGTPTPKQDTPEVAVVPGNKEVVATPDNSKTVATQDKTETAVTQNNTETVATQSNTEAMATQDNKEAVVVPSTIEAVATPKDKQIVASSDNKKVLPPPVNNVAGKPPKKSKVLIPIIAGFMVLILLAAGVGGYFFYQKYIDKQADTVIAYLDDKKYDDALTLYEKYSGRKDSFDNKVINGIKSATEQIKGSYLLEKTDYDTAVNQFKILDNFDIPKLDTIIDDASLSIQKINTSRSDYQDAKAYYDLGDYESALEKYNLVIDEDPLYSSKAKNDKEAILQEMAVIQEEAKRLEEAEKAEMLESERIKEIRENAIITAEAFANDYNYESAIAEIEKGLFEIPDDFELTLLLTLYTELDKLSATTLEYETFTYENTFTEKDKEFMTVLIELPVLKGNNSAYDLINQTIELAKEKHLYEVDLLSKEAKLYALEEEFVPYSYDISYSQQYNNNKIICIVLEGYIYTGGAHGNPIRETYTFDLSTGAQLQLSDLIVNDDFAFSNYIADEFQRMFDETPEEYWEDTPTIVREAATNLDGQNYYLTDEYITIFYSPYELGSFARGYVDIVVPFEGNEQMFTFLQ